MSYLLDTHSFLWFINNDSQLSPSACHAIATSKIVYVSMASIWEIAIKYKLGKIVLPSDFSHFIPYHIHKNMFEILPIHFEHVAKTNTLDFFHRDPFDRLLIAQAICEKLTLISKDSKLSNYPVQLYW